MMEIGSDFLFLIFFYFTDDKSLITVRTSSKKIDGYI